jgi:hypothetical protein
MSAIPVNPETGLACDAPLRNLASRTTGVHAEILRTGRFLKLSRDGSNLIPFHLHERSSNAASVPSRVSAMKCEIKKAQSDKSTAVLAQRYAEILLLRAQLEEVESNSNRERPPEAISAIEKR